MSANGIGALERGYRRTPQRETLALLANALALDDEQRHAFEAAAAPARQKNGEVSGLPLALTSFVGREIEMHEIATLLREHRLVTITGAGGVGKTQTALQAASTLGEGEGSVRFIGLAPVGSLLLVVGAIAAAVGVQEAPNRPLLETLIAYLKNKSLVLILDNCEHVVTEAAVVADAILAGCPRVRILATSREPLRSAGERTYRLPSLNTSSAVELFTDRALAVDHRFALTTENAPSVAELCRRLDGIPLAIELAAARVNLLTVKALTEKLDDRLRLLASGERTALPRQQTLRATIDWSYDLLTAPERRLFERLSVFSGGCTLASATAVCASEEISERDVFDLLSSLIDKSLVTADLEGSEPRYRLLESFGQYAREKLVGRGEQDEVAHRHALIALDLAERLEHEYDIGTDVVWRALAEEEMDNWRAALHWSLAERRDVVLGQRLVGQLSIVWQEFELAEGERWLDAAFAPVGERTPTDVLARLRYAEAVVAWHLLKHNAQLTSTDIAIELYSAVGDALGVARAQSLKGNALACLGRTQEAKTLLLGALAEARRLGNRRLVTYALRWLGLACAYGADADGARRYVAEALPIYEAMGAKLHYARAVDDLSWYEFRTGNAELAIAHANDALTALRGFNDTRLVANVLWNMSAYLVSIDRFDEAEERAREALNLAREHQIDVVVTHLLQHLTAIAVLRPREPAEEHHGVYERAARVLGYVDARLPAVDSVRFFGQEEYNRVRDVLRGAIGDEALTAEMASGAALTEDQAVEEALAK